MAHYNSRILISIGVSFNPLLGTRLDSYYDDPATIFARQAEASMAHDAHLIDLLSSESFQIKNLLGVASGTDTKLAGDFEISTRFDSGCLVVDLVSRTAYICLMMIDFAICLLKGLAPMTRNLPLSAA